MELERELERLESGRLGVGPPARDCSARDRLRVATEPELELDLVRSAPADAGPSTRPPVLVLGSLGLLLPDLVLEESEDLGTGVVTLRMIVGGGLRAPRNMVCVGCSGGGAVCSG